MASEPQDPLKGGHALALTVGKALCEALTEHPRYSSAARALDQLDETDLRRLAFYVAAEEIAKDVDRLGSMDAWMQWWSGVDQPNEEEPTPGADSTPLLLWKIMRPVS